MDGNRICYNSGRSVWSNTDLKVTSMKIDDEHIFREFHKRRLTEYVPAQYFIAEKGLFINVYVFRNKYTKWRIANKMELSIVSTPDYLRWFNMHYQKDPELTQTLWRDLEKKRVSNKYTSIVLASTIFYLIHNIPYEELRNVTGISYVSLKNCEKDVRAVTAMTTIRPNTFNTTNI